VEQQFQSTKALPVRPAIDMIATCAKCFTMTTTPNAKQKRALDLLDTIAV